MQQEEREAENEKTVNVTAEDYVAEKRPWKTKVLGKSKTSPILVASYYWLLRCFIFLQTNSFRN